MEPNTWWDDLTEWLNGYNQTLLQRRLYHSLMLVCTIALLFSIQIAISSIYDKIAKDECRYVMSTEEFDQMPSHVITRLTNYWRHHSCQRHGGLKVLIGGLAFIRSIVIATVYFSCWIVVVNPKIGYASATLDGNNDSARPTLIYICIVIIMIYSAANNELKSDLSRYGYLHTHGEDSYRSSRHQPNVFRGNILWGGAKEAGWGTEYEPYGDYNLRIRPKRREAAARKAAKSKRRTK